MFKSAAIWWQKKKLCSAACQCCPTTFERRWQHILWAAHSVSSTFCAQHILCICSYFAHSVCSTQSAKCAASGVTLKGSLALLHTLFHWHKPIYITKSLFCLWILNGLSHKWCHLWSHWKGQSPPPILLLLATFSPPPHHFWQLLGRPYTIPHFSADSSQSRLTPHKGLSAPM